MTYRIGKALIQVIGGLQDDANDNGENSAVSQQYHLGNQERSHY